VAVELLDGFREDAGHREVASRGCGRVGFRVTVSPDRPVAGNLAIDEEMTRSAAERGLITLRLWWGGAPTVVLGSSEKIEQTVDVEACRRLGVDVVRRSTGGGTVLQTPGVLNYSLTGPAPGLPNMKTLFALGARILIGALAAFGLEGAARGISDVCVGDRKISGNAMAKRWGGLLLHGTLLLEMDLDLVEACLRHPPREPDYRGRRTHRDFLTSLRSLGVTAERSEVEAAVIASGVRLFEEGAMEGFPFIPEWVKG